MRVQAAIYVLLLMLALSVTCKEKENGTDANLQTQQTVDTEGKENGTDANLQTQQTVDTDKPHLTSVSLLTAGDTTTLSSSAPDPCPSTRPNITWWLKKKGQNSIKQSNSDSSQKYTHCSGTITSVLTFTPSVDENDVEVVCVMSYGNGTSFNGTLEINYLKNATIVGNVTVKKGEKINLTCSAESNSSLITVSRSFTEASASGRDQVNKGAGTLITLNVTTILTFLAGAASTAVIVCFALCFVGLCIRCGTVKAVDGNANKADVKLEAVKIQHNPAGTDQAEEDEHTPLQGRPAAAATNTTAVSSEVKVEDTPGEDRPSGEEEAAGEKEQKEVDYACIDYSRLEGSGAEALKAQTEEETEYAEIQIKKQPEEEGAEDLQGGEVQGEAQGLENQEQVAVEKEEIQV